MEALSLKLHEETKYDVFSNDFMTLLQFSLNLLHQQQLQYILVSQDYSPLPDKKGF